jgi:hypothetical protein
MNFKENNKEVTPALIYHLYWGGAENEWEEAKGNFWW